MSSRDSNSASGIEGMHDTIETPESSPNDPASEYNFFTSAYAAAGHSLQHQSLPTPDLSPHESIALASVPPPSGSPYNNNIMAPPPPPPPAHHHSPALPMSESYDHYSQEHLSSHHHHHHAHQQLTPLHSTQQDFATLRKYYHGEFMIYIITYFVSLFDFNFSSDPLYFDF